MNQTQELLQVKWLPKKRIQARVQFCHDLKLNPEQHAVRTLMRHCITHHKLMEYECNAAIREKYPSESWDAYDKSRHDLQIPWIEKRTAAIEKTIRKQCEILGLEVKFEGDPRGCTCKFMHEHDYYKECKAQLEAYPEDKDYMREAQVWSKSRGADVWNW